MYTQSPAARVYVDKKDKGINRMQKERNSTQGETENQTANGVENAISRRKFTFEELMSGRTSFKNWNKDNEESTIEGGTSNNQDETKKVSSLKQKWELGSKSSISSCGSARSSESGDDESNFGNVMKKFQSLQVRNKPALLSFSSFNVNTPTSSRTEDAATPENSTGSVSSRKDMFNNMAKQGKKNEWVRRSMSMKAKKKLSIEEPTVEEEGEEVQSEVRSFSIRGKLAMFESLNEK